MKKARRTQTGIARNSTVSFPEVLGAISTLIKAAPHLLQLTSTWGGTTYRQQLTTTPIARRGRRAKSIGTTTGAQLPGATPMAQKVTRRRRTAKRGKALAAANGQQAGTIPPRKRGRPGKAAQQQAAT